MTSRRGVALPRLLEAVQDEDTRVRLAVYEILTRFESEEAARKTLFAALADPDSTVVNAVTELLKAMTSMDYDALIDLLDSENPTAVAAAIDLIVHTRHRPAAAELTELLNDERMPAYRGATIGQLARQALSAIESSLMDGDRSTTAPAKTSGVPGGLDSLEYSDEEKIIRTLKVLRDDDVGQDAEGGQIPAQIRPALARHGQSADFAFALPRLE